MKKTTKKQNKQLERPVETIDSSRDVEIISTMRPPCDFGDAAYIPYWVKKSGNIEYGIDEYKVSGICGCGDVWICQIKDGSREEIIDLEPNVDVFFSQKEAERKLSNIKKTEDTKKLAKWKRRVS